MGKIRELTTEEKMQMRLDDIIYYERMKHKDNQNQAQEFENMQCDEEEDGANHELEYHNQEDNFGYDYSARRNNKSRYNNQLTRYGHYRYNNNNSQVTTYENYNYNNNKDTRYRGRWNKNYGSYYHHRRGNQYNQKGFRSSYWNDKMIQKIQYAPRGSVFRHLDLYLPSTEVPGAGHKFVNCIFHFH